MLRWRIYLFKVCVDKSLGNYKMHNKIKWTLVQMRQVPLEYDINIAMNGPFWVEVANPENPFTAMLISRS